MENKKRKTTGLLLSILGVLSLVLITAGVTYAFFNYAKEGQTVNTIRTGTIEFSYTETDGTGNGINISNAMPTSDTDGMAIEDNSGEYGQVFRFSIESKTPSSAKIPYVVTLRKTDGILGSNQVKVYLTSPNAASELSAESSSASPSPVANYTYVTSGATTTVKTFAELPALSTNTITNGVTVPNGMEERIMYAGVVPVNQANQYQHSFVLRMWLNGDEGSTQIADYSPYEFMLKSAVSGTGPIDAETQIGNGNFITSTAYYALPDQPVATAYCTLNGETAATVNNETATESNCTGTGYVWHPVSNGRNQYERVAFVDKTNKKFITVSQADTAGYTTGAVTGQSLPNYTIAASATGGYCSNTSYTTSNDCTTNSGVWTATYTLGDVAGYEASEQYYRINGATFTAIVNVYADGQVVENAG